MSLSHASTQQSQQPVHADSHRPLPGDLKQYLPVVGRKQRYYMVEEVSQHNTANDVQVILFGEVYDLTRLVQNNISNPLTLPLISAAGSDITYWFDSATREPRTKVNVNTGKREPYCPAGQYLHINSDSEVKWWKDAKNIIGKLTKRVRRVRVVNMVNDHEIILEVPSEETIEEILTRYKRHNSHGGSYAWKRLSRPLDMGKTLQQNGVIDEDDTFDRLGIPHSQWYIPTLHLFFKDDLTIA